MNETVTVEEIKQTVRSVLQELLDEEALAKISDTDFFAEEMGIGSMAIVQMFVTCQEKYDIDLSNEMQLTEPMSIQTLAEKIFQKLN